MNKRCSLATKVILVFLAALSILSLAPRALIDASAASKDQLYQDLDEVNKQIAALKAKEKELNDKSAAIASQSAGFAREKSRLANEIDILNNDIELLKVEIQVLEGNIAITERKIASTQAVISSTLVDLYLNQDVSLLERIASSKSFSSFLDTTAKYESFTDSLAQLAQTIKLAKADLERQHAEVKQKKDYQETQKREKQARTDELNRAIAMNAEQQRQYAAEKDSVIQQRIAANTRLSDIMYELSKYSMTDGSQFSGDKGGYPWQKTCPRGIDSFLDTFGMYVCECVSYGAWKVYHHYGVKVKSITGVASGYNGGQWPDRLRGYVPMGDYRTARIGDIVSWKDPSGSYGHVAWVEAVDSSGNIWVSEYNVKRGDYSERNASSTGGWMNAQYGTYIHFSQKYSYTSGAYWL
jgi:surface antigen